MDVLDADADGQPEILTFDGDLIEWRGDHFEVVWRVVEADPRDDARAGVVLSPTGFRILRRILP